MLMIVDLMKPFIRDSRFNKMSIRLIEGIQSMMTSFFKGLFFCIKSEPINRDSQR